ncbi:hypothetical protein [Azospirillum soli]|uniref:hypothetical protein n=1 Tax=Azospirillum soli TaxID=1304799 RepID=UPI001AE96188|nr:hypothetical protein [Azospirillum soli]MBP2315638.1 hypothetical protein [Azospirillum soli]
MPIRFEDDMAVFEGACAVDEAMELAGWLEGRERVRVDLGRCTALHTALLQLLMAARAAVVVEPEDAFLKTWVAPRLR